MLRTSRLLTLPLLLVLAFALQACDSNGAMDGNDTVQVSLNAVATSSAAAKTVASKAVDSHVDITEVKILLKSIAFHTDDEEVEDEGEEPPAEDDESEEDTFRLDPVVVVLAPDGTVEPVAVGELPAASYDKVSFHVHKPRGNETPADPDFAGDSPSERYSIVVYGNPPGSPEGPAEILYRSSLNVVQVVDFETAFQPGSEEGDAAVTLLVDLARWFVDTDGSALDPADDSNQNRSRIDRSIRNSFRIFQDSDEDGVDDEQEEGGETD